MGCLDINPLPPGRPPPRRDWVGTPDTPRGRAEQSLPRGNAGASSPPTTITIKMLKRGKTGDLQLLQHLAKKAGDTRMLQLLARRNRDLGRAAL